MYVVQVGLLNLKQECLHTEFISILQCVFQQQHSAIWWCADHLVFYMTLLSVLCKGVEAGEHLKNADTMFPAEQHIPYLMKLMGEIGK